MGWVMKGIAGYELRRDQWVYRGRDGRWYPFGIVIALTDLANSRDMYAEHDANEGEEILLRPELIRRGVAW